MTGRVSLEPNHTHFVIVDDGTEGQEYGEYELYNDVKEAMKKSWSSASVCSSVRLSVCYRMILALSSDPAVPLITILLGANDRGPLENIVRTLDKELPVVMHNERRGRRG